MEGAFPLGLRLLNPRTDAEKQEGKSMLGWNIQKNSRNINAGQDKKEKIY